MCKFSNVSANYQISSVQLKKKHFLKIIFVMVTHVLYCTQNASKLCINMLAVPGWGNAFGFSIFILCCLLYYVLFCYVMFLSFFLSFFLLWCFVMFVSFFCGVLLCLFLSFVLFFMLCYVMFVCFFCGYPNRLSFMRAQQYYTTMLKF
jgi:hypothetical protein